MIARRYAPEFGRFLSVDPLADEFAGWSSYTYTLNDPVRLIDPDGRMPFCVPCSGAFNSIQSTITTLMALGGNQDAQAAVKLKAQGAIVLASAATAPFATGAAILIEAGLNSADNIDGASARAGTAGAIMKLGKAKSTAANIVLGATGEVLGGIAERSLGGDTPVLDGSSIRKDAVLGGITGPISFDIGSDKVEGVRRTAIKTANKIFDVSTGEGINQGLKLFFNDNTLNQRRERDVVEPDKTRVNLP